LAAGATSFKWTCACSRSPKLRDDIRFVLQLFVRYSDNRPALLGDIALAETR
jgi:hypothetical protein